jgi:hypothetical protein
MQNGCFTFPVYERSSRTAPIAIIFWSGHGVLPGKVRIDWQDTDYVPGLFGRTLGAARRSYSAFIARVVGLGRRKEMVGGGQGQLKSSRKTEGAPLDAALKLRLDELGGICRKGEVDQQEFLRLNVNLE